MRKWRWTNGDVMIVTRSEGLGGTHTRTRINTSILPFNAASYPNSATSYGLAVVDSPCLANLSVLKSINFTVKNSA